MNAQRATATRGSVPEHVAQAFEYLRAYEAALALENRLELCGLAERSAQVREMRNELGRLLNESSGQGTVK